MKLTSICRRPAWFIILALLLPSCKNIPAAPPPPTPVPLQLAYTPTLRSWVESLAACAEKQPETALFLDELPFSQFDSSRYDAFLHLGDAPGTNGYSMILGYDELKIIVNGLNPVTSIDAAAFQDLFDGSLLTWEPLSPPNAVYVVSVQPWIYLPESELSWLPIITDLIEHKAARIARLASDPGQVIQGVRDSPGAIGFVPVSWLNGDSEDVKIFDVPGIQKIPVLATAKSEPQGSLRSLLGCVTKLRN